MVVKDQPTSLFGGMANVGLVVTGHWGAPHMVDETVEFVLAGFCFRAQDIRWEEIVAGRYPVRDFPVALRLLVVSEPRE